MAKLFKSLFIFNLVIALFIFCITPSMAEKAAPVKNPSAIKQGMKGTSDSKGSTSAVRGSVDLSLSIFGIWDRGYRNETRNRVFAQRFWRDLGRKNLSGTVTPEGFSVHYEGVCYTPGGQPASDTFVREEAQGRIQGDMLVELRYTMHRKDIWEEEKAELVMRDIPMEQATTRGLWRRLFGMAGANLETGQVDPSFPGHIVKLDHQITFTEDHVTCRLQKVDWGYSDYMTGGLRNVCHIRVQVLDPSQGDKDRK